MTWVYPYLRWLGLTYGDAGIFIKRAVYEAIGGGRPYPLFEDLDLVRRMRRYGKFVHLEARGRGRKLLADLLAPKLLAFALSRGPGLIEIQS